MEYEGEWKNGAKNGIGKMTYFYGHEVHGLFRNGQLVEEIEFERLDTADNIF